MPRPPHPVPYVRDDRETPLCVGRDGEGYAGDLGQKGTGIFLRMGLDDPNHIDPLQQNSVFAQTAVPPGQFGADSLTPVARTS